jgi:hypothetical protein
MNTYQPYTYLIGWSDLDQWYYGVRFAKNCDPSDLWTKYFTSSKYVALLREEHGEPDIVQVRKTFKSAKQAVLWESQVLHRLSVTQDPKWINRNVAGHWDTTQSHPNPLKGKTYAEVYGQRGIEWNTHRLDKAKDWWQTDAGATRKEKLIEQNKTHNTFTTVGLEPHNKIKSTFDFTCEFCNKFETRRDISTQRKRKTCGSKRCAALYARKYTVKSKPSVIKEKCKLRYQITTPSGSIDCVVSLNVYCKENCLNRDILMKHMGQGVIPVPVYKTSSVTRHNTTGYSISKI